jgi:isoleucyl-tRNA synthetase
MLQLFDHPYIGEAVKNNLAYICAEVLAVDIVLDTQLNEGDLITIDGHEILIVISKI